MAIRRNFPIENPYGAYRPPDQCPPGQGGYSILSDTKIGLYELGKTVQLFGSRPAVGGAGTTTYITENTVRISMTQQLVDSTSERLWLVSVNGIETIKYGDAPFPVVKMTKDRILSAADNPPGATRYSTLQAEVIWMDGSAKSCVKLIDIAGGTNIQVFGRNVQVNILAPRGTDIVEDGDVPGTITTAKTGLVFNGIYSARIAPTIVGAPTLDIPKFTRWTQVHANAVNMVEIPPGARKVKVYNSSLSLAATTAVNFWLSDDATNGYSVGTLDFTSANATDLDYIPCGATHIATTPTVAAERYLTFVFVIDP